MMKPKFSRASVKNYTDTVTKRIERVFIRELLKLGTECVNIARSLTVEDGSFTDVTGNLRSSIGFNLYVNGALFTDDFENNPGAGSTDGSEGVQKGKEIAAEIGPLGAFSLVLVAGMDYADEVEARGKDVLSSAYLHAEKEMPKIKLNIIRQLQLAGIN